MNCTSVQVGDVVRRHAGYSHGTHDDGHVCHVAELRGSDGEHFLDGSGAVSAFGNPYIYSARNYELVSRGPVEKKRSGFGRWISQQNSK